MARMRSQSGQLPTRLGVRIAFVRGPIISSMRSTSIWNVSGSTSTSAETMPARASGAMSAENVSAEVMTSSPGSQPRRSTASCSAEVPELTMTRVALAEQLRAPRLELLDDRTDVDPGAQRRGDRLDLVLVGHRPDPTDRQAAIPCHGALTSIPA